MSELKKPLRVNVAAMRVEDADGVLIAEPFLLSDAEQLVRQVNAYDALLEACERALCYLTNANAYEPEQVVSAIIDAMVLTGADRAALDECAKATWHPFPAQAKEPSR